MATETLPKIVARNVEVAISTAGETPNAVARATGIPASTLNRRLLGLDSKSFTVNELERLAEHFGTTPTALMEQQAA